MRSIITISLPPDVTVMLKAYSKAGNNISSLIARLIREYFGGDNVDMNVKRRTEIQSRLVSLQDGMKQLNEEIKRLKKLEDAQKEKNNLQLKALICDAFPELVECGLDGWPDSLSLSDSDIGGAISARCKKIAVKHKVPLNAVLSALVREFLGIKPISVKRFRWQPIRKYIFIQ